MTRTHGVAAGAVCVCAYFFYFTSDGIGGGFTQDDLMNLYRAWECSWWDHARDIVWFFRKSWMYRPAGSLYYRVVQALFGLDPFPYRLGCHLLLLLNLGLAGMVARRLTGSAEVGLLTALLLAFHGQVWPLYTSTGFIYDVLAVTFYCGGLLAYLDGRRKLALPLYVLCMNSKEVAVSWPVVVLAWELLTRPPASWNARALVRWLSNEGRVAMIAAVMTALFIVGRLHGPGSLVESGDAYHVKASWPVYKAHAYHWAWLALYEAKWFTPGVAFSAALAFATGALASRAKPLLLACVWVPAAILPVAFITQRGLDSVGIALMGLAIYVAYVIRDVTRLMLRLPERWEPVRTVAVFVIALGLLERTHARHFHMGFDPFLADGRHVEHVKRRVAEIRPLLRGATHVLMLTDPYPKHEWGSLFTVKLVADDHNLNVHRADRLSVTWGEPKSPAFDLVFRWENGRFVRCDPGPFRNVPASELRVEACVLGSGSVAGAR